MISTLNNFRYNIAEPLYTNENIGTDLAKSLLFGAGNSLCLNEVRFLFANYLNQQIDKNLTKLKKLIERSTNTGD